ncbi:MAG: flap endonuclease Xni [Aeromonadaceae bacterium]
MAHLLIFDALNLIRRLHAALGKQPLDNQALLLATEQRLERTVRGILQEVSPSHVIAVFDGEEPSWRHQLYPDYKAGRTPMPTELQSGMPRLQEALWRCGVDALLSEGDEADDLIATLNQQMHQHRQAVTLISTDKGFCQLLDSGIQIRDYFNRRWLDATFVQNEYGVHPRQLVDFWALTGLSGSHIKGVPGIGPKSARELLQQHESLEQLLACDPKEDKRLQKLHAHQHEAQLAQTLVRLRCDIPLGFNLKEIRYSATPAR